MWVRVVNKEVTPNIDQLIRVTDGINILIPEVRLSDLAGERELSLTSITSGIGTSSPNNIVHGILGSTNTDVVIDRIQREFTVKELLSYNL